MTVVNYADLEEGTRFIWCNPDWFGQKVGGESILTSIESVKSGTMICVSNYGSNNLNPGDQVGISFSFITEILNSNKIAADLTQYLVQ